MTALTVLAGYKQIYQMSVDKEALRMTHLAEADTVKDKQRLGFFSVPISTAIGDDGPYKTRIHPRNQQGKPETSPRNFQTSPPRSGQLNKSFLGPLNSLATTGKNDEFIEEPKRLIKQDHELRKKEIHEKQFYPAASYTLLHKPAYKYKEEANPEKDPKRFRREDGRVKSKPRQLQTNPQSRVISDYFKPLKHVPDPYSLAHDVEWQRQKAERAKEAEAPFSPNKFRTDLFNSDMQVLNDHEIKRTKYFLETKFNTFKHQVKWKDTNANRKGLYGFLSPFPRYMENPPTEIKRRNRTGQKQVFKAMNRTTCIIPSPSITQHPLNLRRSFNHSFSHRP